MRHTAVVLSRRCETSTPDLAVAKIGIARTTFYHESARANEISKDLNGMSRGYRSSDSQKRKCDRQRLSRESMGIAMTRKYFRLNERIDVVFHVRSTKTKDIKARHRKSRYFGNISLESSILFTERK
ncbi:uncharacterized protein LOC105428461 isoform X2 [Pogonomyrmex barbatus]|uniref:Uncharacterized protein LOC105428461 isoform X2 n=1 Tax=Pogonomyrmex barbatus TaxID=144034 RepID=A0A6I9X3W6_9HYME|nr:uncharacterized protein LOC105428461 isoform X2 [Pogonomyrmex barbatus]